MNATTNLVRINGNKKDLKPKDSILSTKTTLTGENLHDPARLFPPATESCELTIECGRSDFSASAIARAVEDAVSVDLRISHRNAGSVARSLERYGFRVASVRDGYDADAELTARRIGELMAQIDI